MVLSWYHRCMARRPFTTQVTTSIVIGAAGDMLAQHWTVSFTRPPLASSPSLGSAHDIDPCTDTRKEPQSRGLDWHRVGIMGLYSGCFSAPLVLAWLKALDRLPFKSLMARVAIDQLCFSPFGLAYYFVVTGILYRQSAATIHANLSQNYSVALLRNYQIWPFIQAVNFYYVPLAYRLLFTQAVALGWNTYLSLLFHRYEMKEG